MMNGPSKRDRGKKDNKEHHRGSDDTSRYLAHNCLRYRTSPQYLCRTSLQGVSVTPVTLIGTFAEIIGVCLHHDEHSRPTKDMLGFSEEPMSDAVPAKDGLRGTSRG